MSKKDWRKQLMRVKQIADQNLGRAEKSEVLSDELQHLEKKVDVIKHIWQNNGKKLLACSQAKKKVPEAALAQSMQDAKNQLSTAECMPLLQEMFEMARRVEEDLATQASLHGTDLDSQLCQPIQSMLEDDIPGIHKTRKTLNKMVLDMDSAKSRYQSAVKESQYGKVSVLKDEMEESQLRVEQCRDHLSTEMFTFISKEAAHSELLVTLIQAQAKYHQQALLALQDIIPKMQEQVEQHKQVPTFSTPLEEHLRRTNREIATVLDDCIATIVSIGLEEEGLFRIAGSASKTKKLKASFDSGFVDMQDYIYDIHCVAGALKLYLRELPEPLMTFDLYDEWMEAVHLPQDQKLQALWCVVDKLPKANYDNLRYLIKFLALLAENSEVNKMTPSNIAIVMGPNLIWSKGNDGPSVMSTSATSSIVDSLITHADWFFPGEVDFMGNLSDRGSPPGTLSSPAGTLASSSSSSNHPSAQALFQATAPSSTPAPPASSSVMAALGQQTLMATIIPKHGTAPTAAAVNDTAPAASPRPNRRSKKPAPLPPAIPDRPALTVSVIEAEDSGGSSSNNSTLERHSYPPPPRPVSPAINNNTAVTTGLGPGGDASKPSPPIAEKPVSPRYERPSEPPPPRPSSKPDKPDKPERPPSQEMLGRRPSDNLFSGGEESAANSAPAKPPRPSVPPHPPRRGHGSRSDKSSDKSLDIDLQSTTVAPPQVQQQVSVQAGTAGIERKGSSTPPVSTPSSSSSSQVEHTHL